MYVWSVLPHDTSTAPTSYGITRDPAAAMRRVEPDVLAGLAFLCVVAEVIPRFSVCGLETTYAATGRCWLGRASRRSLVHWDARTRPVDPTEIYRLDEVPLWLMRMVAGRG